MNYLVDSIGAVVAAMRAQTVKPWESPVGTETPYYMYGHRVEIAKRLTERGKDKILKYKKYPLIALRMDFPELVEDGVWKYTLNIAILMATEKGYNAEERYTNVFRPVLYPLYESFLLQLRNSGLFMWPAEQQYPEHTKYDRPYWGTAELEGNTENIFNDPLDAIELVDLKLNQRIKNC